LPAPVTIADWYDVLTAMRDNGVDIPYAWGRGGGRDQTSFVATFSGAYGVYEDFMLREDGTVTFGPMEPEFREYLTEMNRWYEEDLINQDLVVHTDVDNILPLAAAGRAGAMTTHLWNYQSRYYVPVAEDNPDVDFTPVQYAVLREGGPPNRFRHTTFGMGDPKTITVQARNPLAAMVFLDSLYQDDINFQMNFGTEGLHHRITEDGEIIMQIEPDRELDPTRDAGSQTMLQGITMWSSDGWVNETGEEALALWRQARYDGKIPTGITLTREDAEIVARYETDLKTYADEMVTKFFVGAEPLDRYDEFIRGMERFGLNELLEVYQNAVDRYFAR
jgi:putative aldouronate transport system substrate-binding protein